MRSRAVALRRRRHRLGILPQVCDQLRDARCLDALRVDDQCIRHVRHHGNRRKLGRIKPEPWIEILVDHKGRGRRGEQGVAVGRRPIDKFRTDISGGAGAVLDQNRLAPFARQPVADQPGNRIGGSAGRERHDDLDRTIPIIFGLRRAADERGLQQQQRQHGHRSADPSQRLADCAAHTNPPGCFAGV